MSEEVYRYLGELWNYGGQAVLLFGIPAILLNLFSQVLENPVYRVLQEQYLEQHYGVQSGKSKPSSSNWCLCKYQSHTRVFDSVVVILKLTSYVLVFAFSIAILSWIGAGLSAPILIPFAWWTIKRPRIRERAEHGAENLVEGGLLDENRRLKILSWDDLEAGLDHTINGIRETESSSDDAIESLLTTIACHNDELGRIAKKRLEEQK